MDQATLDKIRDRMHSERDDIIAQLQEMGVSPDTGNPSEVEFEQGFADSGQATAEKARVLSIAEGLIEIKNEIDEALDRIKDGTYGACVSCGTPIPPERLEARPYARECVACKQKSS